MKDIDSDSESKSCKSSIESKELTRPLGIGKMQTIGIKIEDQLTSIRRELKEQRDLLQELATLVRGSMINNSLQKSRELGRTETPDEGIFTDGSCIGNPGRGGWAVIRIRGDKIIDQKSGYVDNTTNNRMELAALIAGYQMAQNGEEITIWSDSMLCVKSINLWAAGWLKNGWKKKDGSAVMNLDLVSLAYSLAQDHPKVKLKWVRGHNGNKWNEYVDNLAASQCR